MRTAGKDPIAELVASLREHGKPSLAWVVRWTIEGRDPVAVAWDASRSVDDMTSLLARTWPERLERATDELERRLGPGWYHRLSSEIAPVLRNAVPIPPTLRELLALRSLWQADPR